MSAGSEAGAPQARRTVGHPAREAVEVARRLGGRLADRHPTREALYHDADLVRSRPSLPTIHALARAGRPRPVTPYYLLLSATLQPEFSAALVGVKSPRRAIADARARLDHFLGAIR